MMNTAIVVTLTGLTFAMLLLMYIVWRQQQQIDSIIAWAKNVDEVLLDIDGIEEDDYEEDEVIVHDKH